MKALVVDDSRTIRTVLRRQLTAIGFNEVLEAGDGLQALSQLGANPALPDVVLVDWNMPEMNGYEFICEARAKSEFDSMSILMVTTEQELEQVQRALEAGADEYLTKPFTESALKDKLALLGLVEGT